MSTTVGTCEAGRTQRSTHHLPAGRSVGWLALALGWNRLIVGLGGVGRLERLPNPLELRVILDRDERVILHAEDHRGLRFLSAHHRLQDGIASLIHLEDIYHAKLVLDTILVEQRPDVRIAAHRGIPPLPIYERRRCPHCTRPAPAGGSEMRPGGAAAARPPRRDSAGDRADPRRALPRCRA